MWNGFFKILQSLSLFLVVFTIYANAQMGECSFNLSPYVAVSVDVFSCKADTLENFSIYDIDTTDMSGEVAYGVTGCPACIGCHCEEGFVGKDTLYAILDLATVQMNDSINFEDSSQTEISSFVNISSAFVYKKDVKISICWVESYNLVESSGGYGDPQAGILHCIYRQDGINQFDLSSVDPVEDRTSIDFFSHRNIGLKRNNVINYDLLGRLRKKCK
jgi:hypothetical protein